MRCHHQRTAHPTQSHLVLCVDDASASCRSTVIWLLADVLAYTLGSDSWPLIADILMFVKRRFNAPSTLIKCAFKSIHTIAFSFGNAYLLIPSSPTKTTLKRPKTLKEYDAFSVPHRCRKSPFSPVHIRNGVFLK